MLRWQLIRKARLRNRDVPATVIAKEVRDAVEEVRDPGSGSVI